MFSELTELLLISCSIELIWTPKSKSNASTPKTNSLAFWPKEISHVMSGIICCACSISAISVLQCALIQWRNDLNKIQEKNESQQNQNLWWILLRGRHQSFRLQLQWAWRRDITETRSFEVCCWRRWSGRLDKGTDLFEVSHHHFHEQFIESFSSTNCSKLEWKAEATTYDLDQGDLIKLLGEWYEKVRPDHEEILLDGTAQSVRYGETLRDRSGRPDNMHSQEVARPQHFVMGNDETELELSVESRSFINRVNDQVWKKTEKNFQCYRRWRKNSMNWWVFMAVTMNSVVFMGKNHQNNCHSIANTTDLTLKQMFDISAKLVAEQDEISGLETIGWVEEQDGRRRRQQEKISILCWSVRTRNSLPSSSPRSFRTQSYGSFISGQCCVSDQFLPIYLPFWMCFQSSFYHQLWINTWRSKFEQETDIILLACWSYGQKSQGSWWYWLQCTTSCTIPAQRMQEISRRSFLGWQQSSNRERIAVLSDSIECNWSSRNPTNSKSNSWKIGAT